MSSIDRIDWHSGGDFPERLPEEAGGTHIGMFLTWIINNDLVSAELKAESGTKIEAVKKRELDGRSFLINECDTKFWSSDLNETGNEFTDYYYHEKYFEDYERLLGSTFESLYEVENTWSNYDLIASTIDHRFKNWRTRKTKRFWEFWK